MTMPLSPVPRPSESSAAVFALRQALLDKAAVDEQSREQEDESSEAEVVVEVPPSADPDDSPDQPNDEA